MITRFGGGKHVNISYRRSPHLAFNNMIKFFNSSRQSHKPQEIMALFLSLVDKVVWVRQSSLEVNRNKREKSEELRKVSFRIQLHELGLLSVHATAIYKTKV